MSEKEHLLALRQALREIAMHETLGDYTARNRCVIAALHHALEYGLPAGIRIDPNEPEWPVVFIDAKKQISWHIQQYPRQWDGHTMEEKYQRVREFLK